MKLFSKYKIQEHKKSLKSLIQSIYALRQDIDDEELFDTLKQIEEHTANPFTFVIVGEVKAGKSSFINALLESQEEICKVAPSPMTDTIQLITYGDRETHESVNDFFKKIFLPIDILKDIGIVDTPGTNSIIDHHQEITERFIPSSDLIVFVFEAKNPYRESAWKFFDYIHDEWRKKIIFILQQKDLLSASDLAINYQGVQDYALKKGIENPSVFSVSAKMELEGQSDQSGFTEVRSFIREEITDGRAPLAKLSNATGTVQRLVNKINDALKIRIEQFKKDKEFREETTALLEDQTNKSKNQAKIFTENIVASYQNISAKYQQELKNGLSFMTLLKRSFSSIFSSKSNLKKWIDELNANFENELNTSLKMKLSEGMVHLSDTVQQMGLLIDLKLRDSPSLLKDEPNVFKEINEKRRTTLQSLHESFQAFIRNTENFIDRQEASDERISPDIAKGSGIAVIGVILSTVASGLVFDITGGVLTAIGLAFAGFSAGFKRNKILRQFKEEVNNGKIQLASKLLDQLNNYIVNLHDKIDKQFENLDSLLMEEEKQISRLEMIIVEAEKKLDQLSKELKV